VYYVENLEIIMYLCIININIIIYIYILPLSKPVVVIICITSDNNVLNSSIFVGVNNDVNDDELDCMS
jgi:hypothetical protein